jgi:hypothetical protein
MGIPFEGIPSHSVPTVPALFSFMIRTMFADRVYFSSTITGLCVNTRKEETATADENIVQWWKMSMMKDEPKVRIHDGE